MSDAAMRIHAALRAQTGERIRHREQMLAEVMRQKGGCRAVALDPPSTLRGRSIVTMHEWPKRRLARAAS